MNLQLYLLFCFLCMSFYVSDLTATNVGDDKTLDSLLLSLESSLEDTNKVNTLNKIGKRYMNTADYAQALLFAEQGRKLAKALDFKKGLSLSLNLIGSVALFRGDYEKALYNFQEGLKIRIEIGDKKGIAASYNNIGLINYNKGDLEKSLEYHLKSLSIKEALGDVQGAGTSYNNIGNIYNLQKNYVRALSSFQKYLHVCEQTDDKYGIAVATSNIGVVNYHLKQYTEAMQSHFKALNIRQAISDKKGVGESYINIANVYGQEGKFEKALSYQLKGLSINQEIGDKNGIGLSYLNIGMLYTDLNKPQEAFEYLTQAQRINKDIGNKEALKEGYKSLASLYTKIGDYENAFNYHKSYSDLKDTLLNEQSNKQIVEMDTRYDSEKKDKELIKKDAEIIKQQVEADKKNLQRNAFIVGFILVLIVVVFVFRSYRQKQMTNLELKNKNELIEDQKKLVEERNKKITDSITYAKRIQQAILPSEKVISTFVSDSFVLLKPKDIVSGDFYWLAEINASSVLIAAVDCTGHGVPGALMSMMGYNLLEQVVKEHHLYQPAAILDELSLLVTESLNNTEEGEIVKDGMDAALCKIDYHENTLDFAGAHNALYLIRNGTLTDLKADKRSIGVSNKPGKFTNHHLNLEKGDSIYIFSDGFVDQKGGPENKKFFYRPFQQLLLDIQHLSMQEQRDVLLNTITEWRGGNEQMDDVLIVGFKI